MGDDELAVAAVARGSLEDLLHECEDCARLMPWGLCPGLARLWPEVPNCIEERLGVTLDRQLVEAAEGR
ncbi:MAG TPA: hypothetical protein VIV06_01810 [Candidatus Limnocylindrales bacterium]